MSAPARRALVTGGLRGIGLGISRALAAEGWTVVACGVREPAAVQPCLDDLERSGARVQYVRADLSNTADRERLIDRVAAEGGLDALVNNAGRAPRVRADLLEATEESFEEVLRTNLQGPYFLTQRAVPLLRASRRMGGAPVIVFVGSVSATMASPNRGEYCVSKAGIAMAARLYALRLAGEGIPVFEVRPGVIATDMTAGVKDAYDRRIRDENLVPEGRWGSPDDVGRIVAALVRGDAPYATGSVINVDGGLSIPRL